MPMGDLVGIGVFAPMAQARRVSLLQAPPVALLCSRDIDRCVIDQQNPMGKSPQRLFDGDKERFVGLQDPEFAGRKHVAAESVQDGAGKPWPPLAPAALFGVVWPPLP